MKTFTLALLIATAATALAGGRTFKRGNTTWYFSNNGASWYSAVAQCKRKGMAIASIDNMGENKFAERLALGNSPHWIGFNDRKKEKHWVWANGSKSKFTYWGKGQPKNRNNRENCVNLNDKNYGSKWNDAPCSWGYKFICRKDKKLCNGKWHKCKKIVQYDGDCDKDSECAGSLKCGKDNCWMGKGSVWNKIKDGSSGDCCFNPKLYKKNVRLPNGPVQAYITALAKKNARIAKAKAAVGRALKRRDAAVKQRKYWFNRNKRTFRWGRA